MDAQDGTSEAVPRLPAFRASHPDERRRGVGPIKTSCMTSRPGWLRLTASRTSSAGTNRPRHPRGPLQSRVTPQGPALNVERMGDNAPRFGGRTRRGERTQGRQQDQDVATTADRHRRRSKQASTCRARTFLRTDRPTFLPETSFPATRSSCLIDGKLVKTLTADSAGTVSYVIGPSSLGLGSGTHKVKLKSMLLDQNAAVHRLVDVASVQGGLSLRRKSFGTRRPLRIPCPGFEVRLGCSRPSRGR